MTRFYFIGLLFLLAATKVSRSQNVAFLDSLNTPVLIDSLLIDRNPNNYSVRAFVNFKSQRFRFADNSHIYDFSPNNPAGLGFGFASNKVLVDIAFNIKSNQEQPTSRFDTKVNFKQKAHYFDYFIQRYKGFNVENKNSNKALFRSDISSFTTGLNYLYMFNHKNYPKGAFRSVVSNEYKSAYNLGVGGFGLILKQNADSSMVSNSRNSQSEISGLDNFSGIGFGAFVGAQGFYSLNRNFYTLINLGFGAGLMFKEISINNSKYIPNEILLLQFDAAVIVGYVREKYYLTLNVGMGYYGTAIHVNSREIINLSNAKLAFGYKLFKK